MLNIIRSTPTPRISYIAGTLTLEKQSDIGNSNEVWPICSARKKNEDHSFVFYKAGKSTRIPVASARGGADHLFLLGAVVGGGGFIALNNV